MQSCTSMVSSLARYDDEDEKLNGFSRTSLDGFR